MKFWLTFGQHTPPTRAWRALALLPVLAPMFAAMVLAGAAPLSAQAQAQPTAPATPAAQTAASAAPVTILSVSSTQQGGADVVRIELGMDPFLGDVFLFLGRDRMRLKVLIWESDGFWLCTKRLESARFGVLRGWGTTSDESTTLSLSNTHVTALLRELVPRHMMNRR